MRRVENPLRKTLGLPERVAGADAAVREVLMVEEIEAAGGWLRDQGKAFIEDAQGDVEDWYNRRAGFGPGELAEYGLDY